MRKFPLLKPWLFLAGAALLVAGVIGFTMHGSGAASPLLWTESHQAAPAGPTSWVAVAKADTPAVVNISTTQVVRNPMSFGEGGSGPGDPFEEFFRRFFGDVPRTFRTHSLGSGFIIREGGYVVTNNHVVDNATEITVKLSDGRQFQAKIIGRDKKTDLALLKIEARNLPVIPFSDSDKLQVGEPVMAIGNPRSGVVVAEVQDGSPAAEAGIQPGDVIVQANRKPVGTIADLRQALEAQKPGEPTLLQIHRKDASLFVALTSQG